MPAPDISSGTGPALRLFGPDIWLADGPSVIAAAGFHYPTRMAVLRLPGHRLLIWSPVSPTAGLRAEIDALGDVAMIVAPNSLHHLWVPQWQKAYPDARTLAAPGLARKRADIAFDGTLADGALPDCDNAIECAVMAGNLITTEVVVFHRPSGTALFADLLQQFPAGWFTGWRARVARADLMLSPELTVPRKFRLAFVRRARARAAMMRVLAWPVERIVIAHGTPVTAHTDAVLRRAVAWLMK